MSRELGAALGIATIGSVVSGLYRTNLTAAVGGSTPEGVVEAVGEGIGIAGVVAEALPGETALALVDAANVAFVDAMTTGYVVSAIFVASAASLR